MRMEVGTGIEVGMVAEANLVVCAIHRGPSIRGLLCTQAAGVQGCVLLIV